MKKKRQTKYHGFRNESEHDKHLDRAYDAFDKILELTSELCQKYLNDEYRELCEDLTWAAYEEGLPLDSGRPASWASGIVHALGWVNFLHDPAQSPHMTSPQVAEAFGVSQQTMLAKSRIIRATFDLMPLDPEWCLDDLLEDNPLVWMMDVNGFITDIRLAPREVQEQAYQMGLIPFVPADQKKPLQQSGTGPRIIEFPSDHNRTPLPRSSHKHKDNDPTMFEGSRQ